ncbi:MAG TPA: hypothetical protein V6C71_06320 [Coleofasciculaceae cyanobacterium]|jgi:hypothetical protein
MKTAYIHIGTHKTGSTSIQFFLFKNRKKLIDRGFLYPLSRIPRKKLFGQHHLAAAFLEKLKLNTYNPHAGGWEQVIIEANSFQERNLIISSENFCLPRFDLEQIYKLKEYLSQYAVKIVIYLRKQDDYLIFPYCQFIRSDKYFDSFKQFIIERKLLINYYQIFKPWQKVFAIKNIIVKVFEPEQFKSNLIDDFLDTINYPQNRSDFIKTSKQTVSPSIKQTNFKLYCNQIAKQYFFLAPEQYRDNYLTKLNNKLKKPLIIDKIINIIPDFIVSSQLISVEEKIELMKEFEESNQKVAREYLARTNGQLFYS